MILHSWSLYLNELQTEKSFTLGRMKNGNIVAGIRSTFGKPWFPKFITSQIHRLRNSFSLHCYSRIDQSTLVPLDDSVLDPITKNTSELQLDCPSLPAAAWDCGPCRVSMRHESKRTFR